MGQQSSNTQSTIKFTHQLFGVIEQPSATSALEPQPVRMKKHFSSLKAFTLWQRQNKYMFNDEAKEIFYLPLSYEFKQEGLCGTAGTLYLECENYKHVLKSEIVNRYHGKLLFDQTELWYLMYNLIEAAFYAEQAGKKIGDVHPSNIVINEKGRTKIVPAFMTPSMIDNYDKIVEEKVADCFLAPEQIDEKLIEKGQYPKVNPCKAQVFSLGVTILMAATLTDCYFLYPRNKLSFSSQKKQDLMDDVAKNFSKYFFFTLNSMLQENPNHRKHASEIFTELSKFQDDILSLKDFDRPTCFNDPFVSEPSIADFLGTSKQEMRGGSALMVESKQTLEKLNNSIH